MAEAATVRAGVRRSPARAALVALRPRQWTKNLLLFAGIVFAAELGDGDRWVRALAAFAAYCAASSAAYLVNDVRDAPADRLHPRKRSRPIARGELGARTALVLAGLLAAAALAVAAALGPASLLLLVCFLALQLAYSLVLKRFAVVDVAAIAGLFVIRAAAGAAAVDVRISPWLLVCTALLALFLGLAKRRAELEAQGAAPSGARHALRAYSITAVDRALLAVAAATVVVYALYAATAHTPWLLATVPPVAFGIGRYLVLVRRRSLGEEPEEIALRDGPIAAAILIWVVLSAVILAVR